MRSEGLDSRHELLGAILNTATEGIFGLDAEGRHTFVNVAAAQMLGYEVAELVGKNSHETWHHSRPGGFKYPAWDCPIHGALSTGVAVEGEEYFIRKDGSMFPVSYSCNSIVHHGEVTGAVISFRDISERRRFENELRVLRAAIEQSPVTVAITDTNGVIEYVNPQFERATGYTAKEAIGATPSLLKAGDRPQAEYEDLWRTIRAGHNWHGVFHNKRKDGSLYWEDAVISPVKDDQGRVLHYLALKQDITQARESREKLERFQEAIDSSADAFFIIDRDSMAFLDVNCTACSMLKYSKEQLLQMGPADIKPYISREALEQVFDSVHKDSGRTGRIETVHQDAEGREFPVEVRLRGYESAGRKLVIAVARNIQAQKDAEDALAYRMRMERFLVDISMRLLNVDTHNVLIPLIQEVLSGVGELTRSDRLSLHYLRVGGGNDVERYEYHRPGIPSLLHDVEPYPEGFVRTHLGRQLRQTRRYMHHTSDLDVEDPVRSFLERQHTRSVLILPLEDPDSIKGMIRVDAIDDERLWSDDEINLFTLLGELITSARYRIRREEHLREARARSDAANAAKSSFLSSMSHELRTPLNAILGFGQILAADSALDQDSQEFVHEILNAGSHLLSLVDEVLDLSRIESGRTALTLDAVSCVDIITEAVSLLSETARQTAVELSNLYQGDDWVWADRTRLRQVLVNLLSNAVKYNRPGGSVTINCERKNDELCISVSDTGYGIPEDKFAELFTEFSRLGRESGDIEGTGIGLALTKRLVELMNGDIEVESTPDEGSTFRILLAPTEPPPMVSESLSESLSGPDSSQAGNTEPNESPDGTGEENSSRRFTILYVEDNPSSIRLMETLIGQENGIRLISARTGAGALQLLDYETPDLLLVDINMPEMDGYEFLRQVRGNNNGLRIPAIALSANAMPGAARKAKRAGFHDYITKPIDIEHFREILHGLQPLR